MLGDVNHDVDPEFYANLEISLKLCPKARSAAFGLSFFIETLKDYFLYTKVRYT